MFISNQFNPIIQSICSEKLVMTVINVHNKTSIVIIDHNRQ